MQKMSNQPIRVEKSVRNEANLKISEQSKSELLSNNILEGSKRCILKNEVGNLEKNRNKLKLGPLQIEKQPIDPKLSKMTLTPDQVRSFCNQNFKM